MLNENYYWLFKKFVIFDVDRDLNIHLIFMKSADIAKEYSITQERLNSIKAEHKPVEKYKMAREEQMIMMGEMLNEHGYQEKKDDESDLMFEYDLSRFNQLKNN